ncbi:MAG: hypothetical protein QF464_13980, partial [Myxococcota bacterium]|nr:hypothetical protein [Myxococcota bacterium]
MVLRIKAVLIALGYGFLVANCAGAPSEGNVANESTSRTETIEPQEPISSDPIRVVTERPEEVVTPVERPEETERVPTRPEEVVEQTPTTMDAVEQIEENMARLETLEIFEVGQLIVDVPDEAYNCYGPCEGFETAEADAIAAAAENLAILADLAEEAMSQPSDAADCELSSIDTNLEALAGLQVVEVGDLLVAEPDTNPNCYNLPCAEDIAAAEALTCERAGALANLIEAASEVMGHDAPEATPTVGELELAAAVEQIDQNLERLEALEIVEIGEMIADIPAEAHNCYGPCPGFETAEADAIAESALRLAELTELAELADDETTNSGLNPFTSEVCSDEAIDANLEALDALGIVEVGDLLAVEAEYSSHCYVGQNPSDTEPCEEDAYEAAAETCYRAAKLDAIVEARQQEILEFVGHEIERSGCSHLLAAGMVFTGGG